MWVLVDEQQAANNTADTAVSEKNEIIDQAREFAEQVALVCARPELAATLTSLCSRAGEIRAQPLPTGERGEPGATGVMGPPGPSGVSGAPGPTGAVGPIGPMGPIGPIGPVGDKGDKGDKGDQGDKGDPGDVGPVGPAGPMGPAGPTCPEGTTLLQRTYDPTIEPGDEETWYVCVGNQ